MTQREEWIHKRLIELAYIAETRELDDVEKREEKRLEEELADIINEKNSFDPNYRITLKRDKTEDGQPCLVAQIVKKEE